MVPEQISHIEHKYDGTHDKRFFILSTSGYGVKAE